MRKILLPVVFLFCFSQVALADTPSVQTLTNTVVKVIIEESKSKSFGSGVNLGRLDDEQFILTVDHVFWGVSKEAKFTINFYENGQLAGSFHEIRVIARNKELDLAVFKVKTDRKFPGANLAGSDHPVVIGSTVLQIGCPQGKDPSAFYCRVAAIDRYLGGSTVECSVQPETGRSGGPLFNEVGEVVGICSCAEPKERKGIYSSWKAIKSFLKDLPYDFY